MQQLVTLFSQVQELCKETLEDIASAEGHEDDESDAGTDAADNAAAIVALLCAHYGLNALEEMLGERVQRKAR